MTNHKTNSETADIEERQLFENVEFWNGDGNKKMMTFSEGVQPKFKKLRTTCVRKRGTENEFFYEVIDSSYHRVTDTISTWFFETNSDFKKVTPKGKSPIPTFLKGIKRSKVMSKIDDRISHLDFRRFNSKSEISNLGMAVVFVNYMTGSQALIR